ncbi:MAG: pyruvate kinase [Chthonomonas sp.]|nr:pyruvate kinase [Chthonomonas sp.]
MKRRTKIVCTLGPAVDSQGHISNLVDAGMNVARLNCSHGDWSAKHQWVDWIRKHDTETRHIALLADLQGPKFRIGTFEGGGIDVHAGQSLTVGREPGSIIQVPGDEIFEAMQSGARVLMGDGDVELKIGSRSGEQFEAKVVNGGRIKSRQGITLVNRAFAVPALTDKDREDVYEAAKANVDFIALSYVRHAADLRELRRLVDQYDPSIRLCAKIETKEALRDIDDILKVADLIMVARGDLGLQMDLEDVPMAQKHIIARCNRAGKPVITATQMLESMITNARPTRAEATDIANAILDGTDAVMLSGETAAGAYPIEAVRTMHRIAEKAEAAFDHAERLREWQPTAQGAELLTEAVAHGAVQLAQTVRAKAIVTTSTSGLTPRMVSRFRPKCPIYCATWNDRTKAHLSIQWGVETVRVDLPPSTDEVMHAAVNAFIRHKKLKVGDTIIVTAGVPAGQVGNTNLIYVETVK